jgi:hypothetical protein
VTSLPSLPFVENAWNRALRAVSYLWICNGSEFGGVLADESGFRPRTALPLAMATMRRVPIVWILLLGLGLPLALPAAGSWRCPDGTPCVMGADGRYHCADGLDQPACCPELGRGDPGFCRHSTAPGSVATSRRGGSEKPGIGCNCRFTTTDLAVAATPACTPREWRGLGAITSPVRVAHAGIGELQVVDLLVTLDSPPPSSAGLLPTAPRAPPSV